VLCEKVNHSHNIKAPYRRSSIKTPIRVKLVVRTTRPTHTYEKFCSMYDASLGVKPDYSHTPYSPMMRALCLRNQAAPITKNAY
jgi:hypothetical protein